MARFRLGAELGRGMVCFALAAAGVAQPARAGTVAAGASHTLAVKTTDGTLWAWGANGDGQLGDNTKTQRRTPVQVTSLSGVVAAAAGAKHSLALKSDGSLWAWGDNLYGQVGNGNTTDQTLPVQVLTGVSVVAAGDYHTIALRSDGTVLTWGRNNYGQLGDGGTTDRSTPAEVTGLGLVGSVAAGGNHTVVVLQAGGAMKAWGRNANGQLGNGTTAGSVPNPVSVSSIINALVAVGGGASTLALKNDATLMAWGQNSSGQLGLGNTTQKTTPTAVTALGNVATIGAGVAHGLALLGDGSVRAWGRNTYGNLGDGSTTQRTSPVTVLSLAGITAITAGQNHNVAVTSTGEVWTWGYNNAYQIGDGTNVNRTTPVKVAEAGFLWKAATPAFSPAPGTYASNQNVTITCVTSGVTIRYTTDGSDPTSSSTVYGGALSVTTSRTIKARAFKTGLGDSNVATGVYTLQALAPSLTPGTGTYTTAQTVTMSTTTTGATIRYTTDGSDPTTDSTPYSGAISVATTTTLRAATFLTGWTPSTVTAATYTMSFGQLAAPSFSPVPQTYLDSVSVTLSAAMGATIRYTTDGSDPTTSSMLYTDPVALGVTTTLKAAAWHVDYSPSQVSSATYTLRVADPLLNPAPGAHPVGTAITVTAATAGSSLHYTLDGVDPTEADLAITSGNTIDIGNFTLKVKAFKDGCEASGVSGGAYTAALQGMVAAGENYSLAVLEDGSAWSWGAGYMGRLGLGDQNDRTIPARITSLSGVRAVAAGARHALALTTDGHVWSWGSNSYGQLGVAEIAVGSWTATPQQTSLTDVVAIAATGEFSAAVKADGTLMMWGSNQWGQLGIGSTQNQSAPVQVLTGVAKVGTGWGTTIALMADGTVKGWGSNTVGQIGDGTTTQHNSPISLSLTSVVDISSGGENHFLARKAGGSLWVWGYNTHGQLATGDITDRHSPVEVASLSNAGAFSTGGRHSVVALGDGTVRACGKNYYGQLGNNSTTDSWVPAVASGPTGVVAVAAGDNHSLAMTADGSIWAWGYDWWGQVGEGGSQASQIVPIKIRDGSQWVVDTPTLAPAGGTFYNTVQAYATVVTPGAAIHYTTNGADPTPSDPAVASGTPLTVGQSATLKLRAWKDGLAPSRVRTEAYELKIGMPWMSPAGTTYTTPQTVTVDCSVTGAELHYTTNGVDPTLADPTVASGGSLLVAATQTLKVKAWRTGWTPSDVGAQTYTMVVATPTLSPAGGSLPPGQPITPASVTPGVEFRYTVNGSDPAVTDPLVPGGGITLAASGTVRVKAWRAGWTPSGIVVSSFYVVEGTVAAPALTPAAGTYAAPQVVTITSPAPGAVVRCAFDGTAATALSSICPTTVSVATTTNLSAVAFVPGWNPSISAGGTYVIQSSATAKPVVAPSGGRIAAGRPVRVYSPESGAVLRYTTSGIDPADTDPVVESGSTVLVDRTMRLKVRAWKAGLSPSEVALADFDVVGAVAAGKYHSVALRSDGTVVAWGLNDRGQLGNASNTNSNVPVDVAGLTDAVAIAAGEFHTMALKSDGTVSCWGEGSDGQLGDGASSRSNTPVQAQTSSGPLTEVVAIAAGSYHSVALKRDGSVWVWGQGWYWQLGLGNRDPQDRYLQARPVQVPGLTGVTGIWAGSQHTLALQTDGGGSGRLWGWGANSQGELGDGATASRGTPVLVADEVSLAAAGAIGSFIVKTDGTVRGTGTNARGQLGNGTTETPQLQPGPALNGVSSITKITGAGDHTLTLTTTGEVWANGFNDKGQLGDGTTGDKTTPVRSQVILEVIDVAASLFPRNLYYPTVGFSLALTADGRVWSWGSNATGALGNGTWVDMAFWLPKPVKDLTLSDRTWPTSDPDGDGLSTEEEIAVGTDPFALDTNGDGLSDYAAVRSGTSPTSPDTDGDGVGNSAERTAGTDPLVADTDGDTVADLDDCYPLDPSRSVCPVANPNDQTPPAINLVEPTNAVLLSSIP